MSVAFRFEGMLEQLEAEADALWQLGCQGIWQDGDEVVAYFPEVLELPLIGNWEDVSDDYLERYYQSLKPIYLNTLVIAPSHSEVTLKLGQKVIWLDPGMAFGSGHHETTQLALAELEQLRLFGKTVLDVGAGSGILAIAADLLGAAQSSGIDNDPITIPIAQENARLNHSRASFQKLTLEAVPSASADVVVANLFAELHLQLMADYKRVLRAEGQLIITGILHEKLERVQEALSEHFVPDVPDVLRTAAEWVLLRAKPV